MKKDNVLENTNEEERDTQQGRNILESRFESNILSGYQRIDSEVTEYPAED